MDLFQFLFEFTIFYSAHLNTSSTIKKAAGLTVPGSSMIFPDTIPETPISHEWELLAGTGL